MKYPVIMAIRPMLASRTGCIFTGQGGEREKAVGGFLFLNLFQVFLSSKSGYPRP
jgi:hypothetical protein